MCVILIVFFTTQSAELEAHLARLKAKAEQKEYNRMVRNVDTAVS